jgi:Mrp family chromosome partitioning ATPase
MPNFVASVTSSRRSASSLAMSRSFVAAAVDVGGVDKSHVEVQAAIERGKRFGVVDVTRRYRSRSAMTLVPGAFCAPGPERATTSG